MGVVIDEVITEIDKPPTPDVQDGDPPPGGAAAPDETDSDLRRRLERLAGRGLRLAAD